MFDSELLGVQPPRLDEEPVLSSFGAFGDSVADQLLDLIDHFLSASHSFRPVCRIR